MIAAAGLAALVLVGGLAVSAVVGSGGAGSPEAAVHRLADAISHEDPLAAADVIAPDEVRSLHATLTDAERKAAELQKELETLFVSHNKSPNKAATSIPATFLRVTVSPG